MAKGANNLAFRASVTAFVLLSAAVGARWLRGFDLWALRTAQARPSERLDAVGGVFSALGGWEVSGTALAALGAGLFLRGRRALAGRLLVAFVTTGVLELAMKMVVPQAPVPDDVKRFDDPAPLFEVESPFPYPSGHTLRSVILFGAIFVLWRNALSRAMALFALAGMAASRVYLGVHWASDVIGGALLGVCGLVWAFNNSEGGSSRWR